MIAKSITRARALAAAMFLTAFPSAGAGLPPAVDYRDFEGPPHHYKTQTPRDKISRRIESLKTDAGLDRSNEKSFLLSFLKSFDIPVSSQLLVFSTTSLQLRFISPGNPRAIYFNEDVYVGYIPGGRMEVVALDPELGAVFYIFDIPKGEGAIRFERSERCMNCHASEDTGFVPGLVAKSVVPGPGGGSLDSFRTGESGHGIPWSERFGGWHVTGMDRVTNHWGNLTGRMVDGEIHRLPNRPGQRFSFGKYPAETSDILSHLVYEHQIGFVNRVVEGSYLARTALYQGGGKLSAASAAELDEQARVITRYILFADEAPFPPEGIEPDAACRRDFQRNRRTSPDGASLKDLDLRTRLFKYRCSYMIYSPVFEGMPAELKGRVYRSLKDALRVDPPASDYGHLPAAEKDAIRSILKATLPDW